MHHAPTRPTADVTKFKTSRKWGEDPMKGIEAVVSFQGIEGGGGGGGGGESRGGSTSRSCPC